MFNLEVGLDSAQAAWLLLFSLIKNLERITGQRALRTLPRDSLCPPALLKQISENFGEQLLLIEANRTEVFMLRSEWKTSVARE